MRCVTASSRKVGSLFAAVAGVEAIDIGFDHCIGRFFVIEEDRSGSVRELAEVIGSGTTVFAEFAMRVRGSDEPPIMAKIGWNRPAASISCRLAQRRAAGGGEAALPRPPHSEPMIATNMPATPFDAAIMPARANSAGA
jgi:hypothetical protein